jgi:hypothetical protein
MQLVNVALENWLRSLIVRKLAALLPRISLILMYALKTFAKNRLSRLQI